MKTILNDKLIIRVIVLLIVNFLEKRKPSQLTKCATHNIYIIDFGCVKLYVNKPSFHRMWLIYYHNYYYCLLKFRAISSEHKNW